MCPTFRALRTEAASPRNQANLLRQIATGAVDPQLWGSEEMKANADLCIHCMVCRTECPAGVDVSSLMVEAKAAYVEIHGLAPTDWFLSRVDLWSQLASRTADHLERRAPEPLRPMADRADLRPLAAPLASPGAPDDRSSAEPSGSA